MTDGAPFNRTSATLADWARGMTEINRDRPHIDRRTRADGVQTIPVAATGSERRWLFAAEFISMGASIARTIQGSNPQKSTKGGPQNAAQLGVKPAA